MASDRSRPIDKPRFGYAGVVAQQGRVTLDRDVNAASALLAARDAFDANAFVGPCGTPDDGYKISTKTASGSPPPNYNPFDFSIGAGVMYLGGQVVTLARGCTYMTQPEWPNPTAYGAQGYGTPQFELFLLDVVETEVSAVEDPDLLDVALGGPDTTGRKKLLQRIRRIGFTAKDNVSDCASAWAAAVKRLAAQGLAFDPTSMSIAPEATLQVGFTHPQTTTNLCDPQSSGGYIGAENQLLRLRVTTIGGAPYLVWGYDNASALYRVKSCSDGRTIVLTSDPPDAFRYPVQGQWVEILSSAAVYDAETGDATFAHCIAEPIGNMHRLAQPYGPVSSDDSANYLVIDSADPLLAPTNARPVFVRVWQNALQITLGSGKAQIELTEAGSGAGGASGASTGLLANLAWSGASPAEGATWEIAVRPSTPQAVYPVEYINAPQPGTAPKRWACPLAFVDWTVPWAAVISDFRNPFLNLVQLTRRRSGECMYTIDPVDVGGGVGLQAAINRARDLAAAAAGITGKFTVCLGPGTFALPAPLRFDATHSGMTLEGCCGNTVLTAAIAADNANLAAFADGLVAITSAANLTLRGLEFHPAETHVPATLLKAIGAAVAVTNLNVAAIGAPRMAFAVRAVNSSQVTIEDCLFDFDGSRPDAAADLIGAGVFVQGACADLDVKGCTFTSQIAPTFNPFQLAQPANAATVNNLTIALSGDRLAFNAQTGLALDLAQAAPQPLSVRTSALALNVAGAAAQPTASPPASLALQINAAQLREQISLAAWEVLIGLKSASGPKPPIIATMGLLAADLGVAKVAVAELDCALGDAAFRDGLCDGVGFGALIPSAAFNTLRLQDNLVQNGIAGLWIAIRGAVTPLKVRGKPYYPSAEYFAEYQYAQALAATIPPPNDPSPPRFIARVRRRRRPAEVGSLLVSGNDIQTLWSIPPGRKPTAQSSCALLLALCNTNQFTTGDKTTASVTGNKLQSGSGIEAPAALVTLPPQTLFTMTGNTIANVVNDSNIAGAVVQPPALSIEVEAPNGLRGVAVAGNALNGDSNLALLNRVGAAPLENLHPLNADPS